MPTVQRLLEKYMTNHDEENLRGIKRKLFFWAIGLKHEYNGKNEFV